VNDVEKQTKENHQAIGDLDRQVATADEKAVDAGKRAQAAADAANNANNAAQQARQQADSATSSAQQAQQGVSRLDQGMQTVQSEFQNLDNYKLVTTEHVYFRTGASTLGKDDQEKLDNTVQSLGSMKNYLIEIAGYADRTGDKAYNRELSRKRADAVVHYLAVEHTVPLRGIRVLGAGSDFPNADNSNRAARKENRRVDVKIYALDLTGTAQALNSTPQGTNAARQNTQTPQPQQ
jgi:outer membrane protein OmpA-like peptidoglycan-associated protein